MYTPTLDRPTLDLPKILDLTKLPVVSLESDLQLRQWRFARWTTQIKNTPSADQNPRETEACEKNMYFRLSRVGVYG